MQVRQKSKMGYDRHGDFEEELSSKTSFGAFCDTFF
jgi:hypothetical protein